MDIQAIKEVNTMIEYMKDSDVLVAKTTKDETLNIKKSRGSFYVDKEKATRPPQMNGFGSLVYYPPSLKGNLYIQTTQIRELLLNERVIYLLK